VSPLSACPRRGDVGGDASRPLSAAAFCAGEYASNWTSAATARAAGGGRPGTVKNVFRFLWATGPRVETDGAYRRWADGVCAERCRVE